MGKEVFHTIRHLKRTFTRDEWFEYCRSGGNIVTTFGKYRFNDHDVCLNPEREEVTLKAGAYGYSAVIKYAHCGNGIWAFGMEYHLGTEGGSFGVSWADKADTSTWNMGFDNERECKMFAWRYILTRIMPRTKDKPETARLCAMIEKKVKEYSRPQIVQLELFE